MSKKAILVDVSLCSGCYNCQISCKDEHVDNDWRPYAAPQPNTGHFWLKLEDHLRGTMPKVKLHYIAKFCAQCKDPACQKACSVGAIEQRDDGLVIINPDKCTGCGDCVTACPIGAIYKNDAANICQKCTGCAHLLDNGYETPRCIEACHSGALRIVDEEELEKYPEKTSLVPEEFGPRVWYLNIPKNFIAGMVLNSDGSDVISNAKCSLTGDAEGETLTDTFGDFWFENLEPGNYTLRIEHDGTAPVVKNIVLTESLNLGEIRLN